LSCADENFEENDRTMTTADLDHQEKSADCHHVSSTSHVATESTDQSLKTSEAKCTAPFDIRKFISTVMQAKSDAEVNSIVGALSFELSGSSNPANVLAVNGTGSDAAQSCLSASEAGNAALDSRGSSIENATAGTQSYSWSSSLPNGSRLEMLASSNATKCEQTEQKSVLPESRVDGIPPSTNCQKDTHTSGDRTDGDGDGAECVAGSTKQVSVSKKMRVRDFQQPRSDALETTFSSPRVSFDQYLSKPRQPNERSQYLSRFDMSASITTSFQPQASASRHLLLTPATTSDSSVCTSSAVVRQSPLAYSQSCLVASSHRSLPDDSRWFVNDSCYSDVTMNTVGIVDSMLCLSMGPLEDTAARLLPVTHHDVTGDLSSYNNGSRVSFAGRIHPRDFSSGFVILLSYCCNCIDIQLVSYLE